MAFDSLTEKLQNVFKNLRSKGRLTEADVKDSIKRRSRCALVGCGCKLQGCKGVYQECPGDEPLDRMS